MAEGNGSNNRAAGRRIAAAIVGAADGVGPAVVAALKAAGAQVVVDVAMADRGDVIVAGIEAGPQAFFDRCEVAMGGVNVLVLPARPVQNKPLLEVTPQEFRAVIEHDLVQVALFMQEGARRMIANRWGRIIVFASMSGKTGAHHNVGPFAAAKGGLLALVRVMAAEMAPLGITVNAIATALFEPQVAPMSEERRAALRSGIPVGRFGHPDEAAEAVLYLASPKSGFVTGETLNMSGGRFMD